MSQSKKKGMANRPAEKAPDSKATDRDQKGRRTTYIIIASVVVAVILIIFGFFYNQEYVAPFRRTIITVDDTSIDMGYFLKRTRLAVVDPFVMLDTLTNELLIKQGAPRYVGEVTPEDIERELRRVARGGSETISESEFKEWYRQRLNETGFSESEYREIAHTSLLAASLHEYLAERVPTVAEQVHLHIILFETYEDAEKIRARWEAGEDFADLAREASVDELSREKGGDFGWLPRGVMESNFDYVAFSLSPGDVSEALPYVSEPSSTQVLYYLLMVSEKADARELDEDSLQRLRDRVLEDWLTIEMQFHEIGWHGLNNGFDSYTDAWIRLQLEKMKK